MTRSIEESGIKCVVHEFDAGDTFLETFKNNDRFEELIGADNIKPLLFMDINMPRMNGFEVLDEMAKSQHRIKCITVLMVTSSDHDSDRTKAKQYNFVKDFACKPVSEEIITTLINTHYPQ